MLYFAFCIHNHQPVGNFDWVLKSAYKKSYWPFLKTLSAYPSVKLSLHTSGFLLDWIVKNCPEYIELLKVMVSRGQVEIVGGGYYEPVLTVIPESDALAQINLLSDRIEGLFGVRPRGLWLAERVWEPTLPALLKKADVDYILVDDYHFIKSGVTKERLGGYYITEDRGSVVKVLPGSERLRYLIPFRPIKELNLHLKELDASTGAVAKPGNGVIYGDDGEKFGVWPGTHARVFKKGWLKGFFKSLSELDCVKPVTLGEYVETERPLGRVYLPTTSYMEMGEWSLPPEASKEYSVLRNRLKRQSDGELVSRFVQGGTWRNFFAKYPESNWMHKRMLMVSSSLNGIGRKRRASNAKVLKAEGLLYRAQCNDAYWHGIFGGLYLPHLRAEVYRNLIEAEGLLTVKRKRKAIGRSASAELADLDADGLDEVAIRTRDLNLFIKPDDGGALIELDYKPAAVNLSNTMSRWPEAYHRKLRRLAADKKASGGKSIHERMHMKEAGLDKRLKVDLMRRASLRDHVLAPGTTFQSFSANEHEELGAFPDAPYETVVEADGVALFRTSTVAGRPLTVRKMIRPVGAKSFSVDYHVEPGPGEEGGGKLLFGVEMNFILPCSDGPMCRYGFHPASSAPKSKTFGGAGRSSGVTGVSLTDKYTDLVLTIEIDTPATVWRYPVYAVSLSETGFEKIFQGSCLLFLFPLDLGSADGLDFRLGVGVKRLTKKRRK
jgi:hypothetical protein